MMGTPRGRSRDRGGSGRRARCASGLLLAALGAVATGCSGHQDHRVSGEVSYDSVAVAQGTITFEPADGKGPSAGGAIAGGRYAVVCANPGGKIVRITATRSTGRKVEADAVPGAPLVDEIAPYIPEQYNDRSTLTCDVVAGPNTFDFHLKSP